LDITTATTFAELPAAHFFGQAAVERHGWYAAQAEQIIADWETSARTACDESDLREALRRLGGFDETDVEWIIANPGKRMPVGYG
jgi:hypothetical protein